MKACIKCGAEKQIDDFYVNKRMSDGHLRACKACVQAAAKIRRASQSPSAEQRRKAAIRSQRYAAKHREKYLATKKRVKAERGHLWKKQYTGTPEQKAYVRAKGKEWYAANRDKALADRRIQRTDPGWKARRRDTDRRSKFGLEPGQYESMVAAQGGKCAICRETPKRSLCVDHNHDTGAVRGLLCHACNSAIGHFHESPRNMLAAIAYLMRYAEVREVS